MTITIRGRRYRWRGWRRRRPAVPARQQLPAIRPVCPRCLNPEHWLEAAGVTDIGPRVMREPVRCIGCGFEFALVHRIPEELRRSRRHQNMAMLLAREGDGPRGA